MEYYRYVVRKQKWLVWFKDLVRKHIGRKTIRTSYSEEDKRHILSYLVSNHKHLIDRASIVFDAQFRRFLDQNECAELQTERAF